MVVVNLNSNSKNVSPNIASYGSVVSTHATQQHHECSIMPNTKADIDTSDLYPTLNFNVSTTHNFVTKVPILQVVLLFRMQL